MTKEFDVFRAVHSLTYLPYIPIHDTCEYEECTPEQESRNAKLATAFHDAYLKEANMYGKGKLAKKILKEIIN